MPNMPDDGRLARALARAGFDVTMRLQADGRYYALVDDTSNDWNQAQVETTDASSALLPAALAAVEARLAKEEKP